MKCVKAGAPTGTCRLPPTLSLCCRAELCECCGRLAASATMQLSRCCRRLPSRADAGAELATFKAEAALLGRLHQRNIVQARRAWCGLVSACLAVLQARAAGPAAALHQLATFSNPPRCLPSRAVLRRVPGGQRPPHDCHRAHAGCAVSAAPLRPLRCCAAAAAMPPPPTMALLQRKSAEHASSPLNCTARRRPLPRHPAAPGADGLGSAGPQGGLGWAASGGWLGC